ncbi:MAG: hypothetical protein ACM30G_01055 [Micromonosporaceae bacterium]
MRGGTGFLSRRGRVWAWLGFLVMAAYAPVTAVLATDDSWLLSVTVAALVGVVIVADDTERRRWAARAPRADDRSRPDEG